MRHHAHTHARHHTHTHAINSQSVVCVPDLPPWLAAAADGEPVSREQYNASIGLVVASSSAAGVSEAQLVESLAAAARAASGEPGGNNADAAATGADGDADGESLAADEAAPSGGDGDTVEGGVDAAEEGVGEGEAPGAAPEGPYVHPSGCRGYLEAEVVPLLKRGMFEMAAALENDRLKLINGDEWTEEGHLPQGWTPFSPFRCVRVCARVGSWSVCVWRARFQWRGARASGGGDGVRAHPPVCLSPQVARRLAHGQPTGGGRRRGCWVRKLL